MNIKLQKITKIYTRKLMLAIAFFTLISSVFVSPIALAISQGDTESILGDTTFYDPNSCNSTNSGGTSSKAVVVIDPGHSPTTEPADKTDPTTGLFVKDYENDPEMANAYTAATKIQTLLTNDGYTVVLTKTSANDTLDLGERAQRINDSHGALVVTLHSDPGISSGFLMYPDAGSQRRPNQKGHMARLDGTNGLVHPSIEAPSKQAAETMAPILAQNGISGETAKTFSDEYGTDGLEGNGLNYGNTPVQTILTSIPAVYSEAPQDILPTDQFAQAMTKAIEAAVPALLPLSGPIASSTGSPGAYTLDQVKTFASEPITSTWNISNSTVEQWFLKPQNGSKATIRKYNLKGSNIGQVTSAVEAANVSPVFFYLYTVNEGGGAGGFINHFSHDTGNSVTDAKNDAEYLALRSKDKSGVPATGGGEPSDMPTAEAQQIYSSLPSGSIGVVYIQATAAVTAELEDLSGKTGDWSGLFNKPLENMMDNIKKMYGDPEQGGSTSTPTGDCTGGVTGQGIASAVSWAVMIANNNGYGYDQSARTSGWAKWQSDPNCTNQCGSFDCSSLIAAALTEAGYFTTNPNFDTSNEAADLTGAGFKKIATSATTSANLQPGDILLAANHTEMYIGNNQNVGAHFDEKHGISGGKVGDQTGDEISVKPFYDDNWIGVFRAPN